MQVLTRGGEPGKGSGEDPAPMPTKDFRLLRFEERVLLGDLLVQPGSLPWLLREVPEQLFPDWLFLGWKGEGKAGRAAWPGRVLMALLLLRHSEAGQTRLGAVRRATTDASWRAALRLPWSERPPGEKTLREFEAFLRQDHPEVGRPRVELAFEHWLRLCIDEGLLAGEPVWVADSTPMWCFGAVLGTVRLLGDGLRSLGRQWARARKVSVKTVALEWEQPLLLAKSTKGYFEGTDWADERARADVLEQLAAAVTRVVEQVRERLPEVRVNKHKRLARLCRNLLRVVTEDLENADDGRLHVVHRRSAKRLISLHDPDAQHFRKSRSKVCSGFKIHALGDAISGLVVALTVTPGGVHDGSQRSPLLVRATALVEDIEEVLADAAYGGMGNRNKVAHTSGVKVIAPPVGNSRKGNGLGKEDCGIDFDAMVATCPGGVSTSTWQNSRQAGETVVKFVWPKGSHDDCACRTECPVHKPRKCKDGSEGAPHRSLRLHPDEQGLRAVRADWAKPETRARYRKRTLGERLMRELTRRGARRAAGWGIEAARLQACLAAAVSNLLVLAKNLAAKRAPGQRPA